MKTNTTNICPQCGAPLPPDAPAGLCPACVMAMNLATPTLINEDGSTERVKFDAPKLEEIIPLFQGLEIIELLGQGGMGVVYKARQKELDRMVALKILPKEIGETSGFAERFAREARALGKLNHPNIVTLYEFGHVEQENGAPLYYFLMEYVDGLNLRQLLHNGRIEAREALSIVPQICDALQYAHDEGIVHRDIKPENILLDRRGNVKVADFGLAKIVEEKFVVPPSGGSEAKQESRLKAELQTLPGKIMGTPKYMSPEQIKAPGEVDHRADIYALGVVFYQMLTGEMPEEELRPPSKKVHIDVRLDEVVLRALEQKPDLRYQQASVLKTSIETIANAPASVHTDSPAHADVQRRVKGPAMGLIAVALANITIVIILLIFSGYKVGAGEFLIVAPIPLAFILLPSAFLVYAGLRLMKLERWGAGIAASVLAIIIIPSIIIGLPIGIWALVVLNQRQVKDAFTTGKTYDSRIGVPKTSIETVNRARTEMGESRLSRFAIAGAVWTGLGLICMLCLLLYAIANNYETPKGSAFGIMLIPLIIYGSAIFAGPILGWIAVSKIKKSNGRLSGLGLAIFNGLFFPLAIFNLFVAIAVWEWIDESARFDNAAMIIALLVGIKLNFWLVHLVWRKVNTPLLKEEKKRSRRKWGRGVKIAYTVALVSYVGLNHSLSARNQFQITNTGEELIEVKNVGSWRATTLGLNGTASFKGNEKVLVGAAVIKIRSAIKVTNAGTNNINVAYDNENGEPRVTTLGPRSKGWFSKARPIKIGDAFIRVKKTDGVGASARNPYFGRWEFIFGGERLEIQIKEGGRCTLIEDDDAWAGTWRESDGKLLIETENEKVTVWLADPDTLMVKEGSSEAFPFKRMASAENASAAAVADRERELRGIIREIRQNPDQHRIRIVVNEDDSYALNGHHLTNEDELMRMVDAFPPRRAYRMLEVVTRNLDPDYIYSEFWETIMKTLGAAETRFLHLDELDADYELEIAARGAWGGPGPEKMSMILNPVPTGESEGEYIAKYGDTGTWSVQDGNLIRKITESRYNNNAGACWTNRIIEASDRMLVLEEQDRSRSEWYREITFHGLSLWRFKSTADRGELSDFFTQRKETPGVYDLHASVREVYRGADGIVYDRPDLGRYLIERYDVVEGAPRYYGPNRGDPLKLKLPEEGVVFKNIDLRPNTSVSGIQPSESSVNLVASTGEEIGVELLGNAENLVLLGMVQERIITKAGANDEGYIGVDFESGCLFTPSVPLMEQLKFKSREAAERIPELMAWVDETGVDLLFHLEDECWSMIPLHKLVSGRSPFYRKNIQSVTAADLTFYEAEHNGEKIFYPGSWTKIPYGLASENGHEYCLGFISADGAKGVFERTTQADPNLIKIRYRLITDTTASSLDERERMINTFHVERNEVDVEIVAVTRNPRAENPQWWKPDGTPIENPTWKIENLCLPETLGTAAPPVLPENEIALYHRYNNLPENVYVKRSRKRWSPTVYHLISNHEHQAVVKDTENARAYLEHIALKEPVDRIDLQAGAILTDAEWEPVALFDGEQTTELAGKKVLFSPPRYDKAGKRHIIDVMHDFPREEQALRLRACLKNGTEEIVDFHSGTTPGTPTKGYALIYPHNFKLKDVEEYVLEWTPWLKTEFKNIALQPCESPEADMRELEQAQARLEIVEQQFEAGMVASDRLTEAQYAVDIIKANMEGDPEKVARLWLDLAKKQLAHKEACFDAGLVGPMEVEKAKEHVSRRTKELEEVGIDAGIRTLAPNHAQSRREREN